MCACIIVYIYMSFLNMCLYIYIYTILIIIHIYIYIYALHTIHISVYTLNATLCSEVLFTQIAAGYGDRPKRLLHVFTCRASECSLAPGNEFRVKGFRV